MRRRREKHNKVATWWVQQKQAMPKILVEKKGFDEFPQLGASNFQLSEISKRPYHFQGDVDDDDDDGDGNGGGDDGDGNGGGDDDNEQGQLSGAEIS